MLSMCWPSCGLDSRLSVAMVRISCHSQWSVDYFQWNAFVIVIIVVARCSRASWNLFNGKCISRILHRAVVILQMYVGLGGQVKLQPYLDIAKKSLGQPTIWKFTVFGRLSTCYTQFETWVFRICNQSKSLVRRELNHVK